MLFENEAAFEAALIHLLIDKYGWEPEILRYKTGRGSGPELEADPL